MLKRKRNARVRQEGTTIAPNEATEAACKPGRAPSAAPFYVAVDRQLKSGHDTYEAAERAALAIKKRYPRLQVTVYEAETRRQPGEILASILLSPAAPAARSIHLRQGERDSFDWPIADVAVLLELAQSGVCGRASIVLGAAAPVPDRAKEVEAAVIGERVSEETTKAAGRAALAGAAPLTKNAYKIPIFETLVRRAILTVAHLG